MARYDLSEYEPVEVRLARFKEEWPDSRVKTAPVVDLCTPTRFVVEAAVYRLMDDEHPVATGLAYEDISDRGVNQMSALENCETSALGRALANAGYAPKGKRPSREEMAKANRGAAAPLSPDMLAGIIGAVPLMEEAQLRQVWQENTAQLDQQVKMNGETVCLRQVISRRKAELDQAVTA